MRFLSQQQTEFNLAVVDAIAALTDRLQTSERMWMDAEKSVLQLRRQLAESTLTGRHEIERLDLAINESIGLLLNLCQERWPNGAPKPLPIDRENQVPSVPKAKLDYFLFEMRYRGSTAEITRRHEKYLKYFQTKHTVVDLGCGRGEFLNLLLENGVPARGRPGRGNG